jgi:hypothetical protein
VLAVFYSAGWIAADALACVFASMVIKKVGDAAVPLSILSVPEEFGEMSPNKQPAEDMDNTRQFLHACVKYAARHKKACIAIGSVLLVLYAMLSLLSLDEIKKEPLVFVFVVGMCIAIILTGFYYERKAARNTQPLLDEFGLNVRTQALQYRHGHHIKGKGHEITITAYDLLLFNKNGLTYIPLSCITNVSTFTFVVTGKFSFATNVILHIPQGTICRVTQYLESVYGKQADLSTWRF